MRKIIILIVSLITGLGIAQPVIPTGIVKDSIILDFVFFSNTPANLPNIQVSFYYYKPTTYNPLTSPILFAIHGAGGNGLSEITDLTAIADKQQALIIAPNLGNDNLAEFIFNDSLYNCQLRQSKTRVFKAIYRHTLLRENRNNVPAYLIGFSQGGQFVSRYMQHRQAYADSIPLKMAVSSNAYFYTFPTDTLSNVLMTYPCGYSFGGWMVTNLGVACPEAPNFYTYKCPDHKKQLYEANYGVLIGNADTIPFNDGQCAMVQGINRYQRAQSYYNFAVTDAPNYGTTCNWKYKEVNGVGHDQFHMYNDKNLPTDTFTIAERLLFQTTIQPTTQYAPIASFYATTPTVTSLSSSISFVNTSTMATSYLWEFGDGTTSTLANPVHTYTNMGITCTYFFSSVTYTINGFFKVQLKATNANGCSNWSLRNHYIRILNGTVTNVNKLEDILLNIDISPNPAQDNFSVTFSAINGKKNTISITDALGKNVYTIETTEAVNIINTSQYAAGIYYVETTLFNGTRTFKKIIIEH